jgi:hypothetical protein
MSVRRSTWWAALAGVAGFTAMSACTVTGVGYDGSVGVGVYDEGFYEPYGYDYGGWGSRYRVGPPGRGGYDRGHGGPGPIRGGARPFRAAPPSRSMPSIPSHGRR